MTSRNAAVYGVGGLLLVACLAAANMPQDDETPITRRPQPTLILMGVAEETTPAGPRRTAVIGEGETIYMVGEGEAVGDRYRVKKIGADAVELEDVVSKAYRRLALR